MDLDPFIQYLRNRITTSRPTSLNQSSEGESRTNQSHQQPNLLEQVQQQQQRDNSPREEEAIIPWNWTCLSLFNLLSKYPGGVTEGIVFSELQTMVFLVIGWAMNCKEYTDIIYPYMISLLICRLRYVSICSEINDYEKNFFSQLSLLLYNPSLGNLYLLSTI